MEDLAARSKNDEDPIRKKKDYDPAIEAYK
jgi:hypothetical protein